MKIDPDLAAQIRPYGTRVLLYPVPQTDVIYVTAPAHSLLLRHPMRCMDCARNPAVGLLVTGGIGLVIATLGDGTMQALCQPPPTSPYDDGGYLCLACMHTRAAQPGFGWWQISTTKEG